VDEYGRKSNKHNRTTQTSKIISKPLDGECLENTAHVACRTIQQNSQKHIKSVLNTEHFSSVYTMVAILYWRLQQGHNDPLSGGLTDKVWGGSCLCTLRHDVSKGTFWVAFLGDIAGKKTISPIVIDVTVPWSVCLSVCVSVTFVHCAQTAEDIDTISFA